MKGSLRAQIVGALLGACACLGALEMWHQSRAQSVLEAYRQLATISYRQAGEDPEVTVAERIALIDRAPRRTREDAELLTARALEKVNEANARLLAGHTDEEGEKFVSARLQEALDAARRALLENPTDTEAWLAGYRVLESARILGRPEIESSPSVTQAFLDGAVRSNPNSGDLRRALASGMVAAGNPERALEQYRLALQDDSVDGSLIAREMLDSGFTAEDALTIVPARFHDQYATGVILSAAGRTDLAEKAFRAAREASPQAYEPWTALCNLAEGDGRHADALEYAKGAFPLLRILRPPERSAILLCAATAARSLDDDDAAIEYGTRALGENPRNLFLYNFLGSILYARGDCAGAVRYWRTLLDEHGKDPYVLQYAVQFYRSVGNCYFALGDRSRAARAFLDVLAIEPQNTQARTALERMSSDTRQELAP